MTVLQGPLADRDAWSAVGHCPIEKTMAIAGTKSAMLIMREAFYGTTRFDDFARRVGITKAATSARLSELVDAGVLEKRPYREPGQRSRDEYVLTERGPSSCPWCGRCSSGAGSTSTTPGCDSTHLELRCRASVEIRCAAGHEVPADELGVRLVRRGSA